MPGSGPRSSPMMPVPNQYGHHHANSGVGDDWGLGMDSPMMPIPNQTGHHHANAGVGSPMMPVPNQYGHHHANSGVGDEWGLGYPEGAPMMPIPNRFGHRLPNSAIGSATDDSAARMKQALIESAAQMAAVQMGASATLFVLTKAMILVAPIGTIIGVVLTVIQLATSVYVKAQTKKIIANTVGQIKGMAANLRTEVLGRASAIAEEEFPAAQALAASGQPLGESWFTQVVRKVLPPIAKPVIQFHAGVVRAVGNTALNAGIKTLTVVGDTHGAEVLQKRKENFDNRTKSLEAYTQRLALDPIQLARQMVTKPAEFLVGTQQLDVIRKKCYDLAASAAQEIAKARIAALAPLETPEYRAQVRTELALQIRQDPQALQQARDLARITQQAQTMTDNVVAAAENGQTSVAPISNTGGVLALGAAAVLGFLWIKG